MGVPGFYGHWLRFHAKGALSKILPSLVSCLYFDLNGYYHAAFKLATEGVVDVFQQPGQQTLPPANRDPVELLVNVKNKLNELLITAINTVRPVDGVVFAVDGPAPRAKLAQQRGRRFRSAYAPSEPKKYDSNALTPGTEMMFSLEEFMHQFIATYQKYLPPQVIFSGHLIAGEGEHKIMDYLRNGVTTQGVAAQQGGVHVLWGLDADLILLSLVSPVNNIYLARENSSELIDIDRLKAEISNRVPNAAARPTLIDDFVAIMELVGNDFLPHQPSLQQTADDVEILFKVYADGNYQLTDPINVGELYQPGWRDYLTAVAAQEPNLLIRLAQVPVKYPSRYLQAAVSTGSFNYEVFRNTWYSRALGLKGDSNLVSGLQQLIRNYQPTSYDINSGTATMVMEYGNITANDITTMVKAYLRTLAWCYRYYKLGTAAINTEWCYPYYHTPLFSDIALVMADLPVISGYQAYPGMRIFNALQQLVAVLPSSSVELLPEELRPLMSFNSPIRDIYPTGFQLEMDGRNKDHEGVPLVPIVDGLRIINAVATIAFAPKRLLKWKPGSELVVTRTVEQQEQLNLVREMRERVISWEGRDRTDDRRRDRGDRGADRGGRGGDRGGRGGDRGGRGGDRGGRRGGLARPSSGGGAIASSSGAAYNAPATSQTSTVPTNLQPVMALPGGFSGGFAAPANAATVPVSQQPIMAMPGAGFPRGATQTVGAAQQPIYALPSGAPPVFNPGANFNQAVSNAGPPVPINLANTGYGQSQGQSQGQGQGRSSNTGTVPVRQQPIMAMPSGSAPVPSNLPMPVAPTSSGAAGPAKQLKYPSFMLKPLM